MKELEILLGLLNSRQTRLQQYKKYSVFNKGFYVLTQIKGRNGMVLSYRDKELRFFNEGHWNDSTMEFAEAILEYATEKNVKIVWNNPKIITAH